MENSNSIQKPLLKKSIRWCIFLTIIGLTIHVGQASGIMSPAGKYIKVDLQMMDMEYGSFSALYAVGRIWGALLFGHLFNAINRKYLVIFAAFLHGIINISFRFTSNGYLLLGLRMISGIGYAIINVYQSIWVGQFAVQKYGSLWKNISSMLGSTSRASGYIIDLYFGAENWRNSFTYCGSVLIILGVITMFYPSIYFSSKLSAMTGKDGEEVLRPSQAKIVSMFNVRKSDSDEREVNLLKKHKIPFTTLPFVFLLLARCANLSLRSVMQFWTCKYVYSLDCDEKTQKPLLTWIYTYMIIMNPFIGSKVGKLMSKYIGGYKEKKSLYVMLGMQIFACAVFFPAPMCDKWYYFLIFGGLYQIFGSACLANYNNLILATIPASIKRKSTPIINVCSTAFGSLPAPPIYGLILDYYGGYDRSISMKFFRCYVCLSILYIILTIIIREINFKKEENKEGLIEKEESKKEPKLPLQTGDIINDYKINDEENDGTELKESNNLPDKEDIKGSNKKRAKKVGKK